jgi:hypothetical protein
VTCPFKWMEWTRATPLNSSGAAETVFVDPEHVRTERDRRGMRMVRAWSLRWCRFDVCLMHLHERIGFAQPASLALLPPEVRHTPAICIYEQDVLKRNAQSGLPPAAVLVTGLFADCQLNVHRGSLVP